MTEWPNGIMAERQINSRIQDGGMARWQWDGGGRMVDRMVEVDGGMVHMLACIINAYININVDIIG